MQEIDSAVVFAKNCDDWRREYMTLALEIEREKKAAMAEGMAQGMVNAIKNLMKNANITSYVHSLTDDSPLFERNSIKRDVDDLIAEMYGSG